MADRYYASGLGIYQRPRENKKADGTTTHSFGFRVATVDHDVLDGEAAAKEIANAMNLQSILEEGATPEIKLLQGILASE